MNRGAVAIDLGATSVRYAAGWIEDGCIRYEIVEQVPNRPVEKNGHVYWDAEALFDFCRRAWNHAEHRFEEATVGIDSWGVDHGFLHEATGLPGRILPRIGPLELMWPPFAYRDLSHQEAFEQMAGHREHLYALTGIQHQPFNTIYQLAARRKKYEVLGPHWVGKDRWLLLPDLMGWFLTGVLHCEYTMASTTQLMGLDDDWCPECFALANWKVPTIPISRPGKVLAIQANVSLVSVGSHDTASAVFGLGPLPGHHAFLNVGTWSLLGTILEKPLLTNSAFTNERTVDGKVRYLANIPGFYVINRVHEELGIPQSVPEWLAKASPSKIGGSADLTSQEFFNPSSMCEALAGAGRPESSAEWATLALASVIETTARQLEELSRATGRIFRKIRLAGGGSRSENFCQGLADRTGLPVLAGPEEATLLGNLGMQFVASGAVGSIDEASDLIARSFEIRTYEPHGAPTSTP